MGFAEQAALLVLWVVVGLCARHRLVRVPEAAGSGFRGSVAITRCMFRRYFREGFQKATADLVQRELQRFERPGEVEIFFSAHGVPVSYVEQVRHLHRVLAVMGACRLGLGCPGCYNCMCIPNKRYLQRKDSQAVQVQRNVSGHGVDCTYSVGNAVPSVWGWHTQGFGCVRARIGGMQQQHSSKGRGAFAQDGDPYKEEMEQCVAMIMARLRARGVSNHHTLAYQSRVGPVRLRALLLHGPVYVYASYAVASWADAGS